MSSCKFKVFNQVFQTFFNSCFRILNYITSYESALFNLCLCLVGFIEIKILFFFFWSSFDWPHKLRDVLDEIFVNKVFTGLFSMSAVTEVTVSFLRKYFLLIFKNVIKYPHGIVCSIAFSAHNCNMTENHPLHKPKPNVFIMDNVWLLPFFHRKDHYFSSKIHISIKYN